MKRYISCIIELICEVRKIVVFTYLLLSLISAHGAVAAQPLVWIAQAPGPNTDGQVENIKDREVVGAVNAVAVHPTDTNIVYAGSVNGGIWKTRNAMAANPSWEPQTDDKESLSIAALEFDPTDSTHETLVAGVGHFSSFYRQGGRRCGLLRTTDGGKTWSPVDGGGRLRGLNISGVAPRQGTIVISVNDADNAADVGVWRTTANTWFQVSGANDSHLPKGLSFEIASDPSNPARLFTNAGTSGVYRSTDAGETWAKVSDQSMDDVIANAENMKISIGPHDNVYVAIVVSCGDSCGDLAGVFHSADGGNHWTAMDLPRNADGGLLPGHQGGIHLSLAADRNTPNLVYIGGDRQDGAFTRDPSLANSIGARDYSGRLFRGDASKLSAKQWVHLTHSNVLGAVGGGTKSCSAPHGDSRNMAMAANGDLIEVDDGGIYRRSTPQTNKGDWFSMNGDMQVTELHAVAWDQNSHIVIGGAQDTGTPQQRMSSNARWRSVSTADGGVVAVDATSTSGLSIRYSSIQYLGNLLRQVYDATNVLQSVDSVSLSPIGRSPPLEAQFYTPIKLNSVVPTRIVFGAANGVYESFNLGDTIRLISPVAVNETDTNAIGYGAKGNPDILYVGSGARVYVRTAASPAALRSSTAYTGHKVVGVVVDQNNPNTACVLDAEDVYYTINAGDKWNRCSGNLSSLNPGDLHSIAFINGGQQGSIAIGGESGVFTAQGPSFSNWSRLGTGLPNAIVLSLEYNTADNVLVAGTQGRGAWTLPLAKAVKSVPPAEAADASTPTTTPTLPSATAQVPARLPAAPNAQLGTSATFQLSPRVTVDREENRAYAMSPQGGIDAIDLKDGKLIWTTKVASKPLGIVRRQLIAQTEASDNGTRLQIVTIDPSTGHPVLKGTAVDLPPGVPASVNATARGELLTSVQPEKDDAVVSWQFQGRRNQGLPPGTADAFAPKRKDFSPPGAGVVGSATEHGAFRLNLSSGSTSAVDESKFKMSISPPGVALSKEELETAGDRNLSADGRHVVVSRRTGDEKTGNKYTLTVYDASSGERLGDVKGHAPPMSFFVNGFLFIDETKSYIWRKPSGLEEQPPKLRAVDLKTGEELWSQQIRDTSYRGPAPP